MKHNRHMKRKLKNDYKKIENENLLKYTYTYSMYRLSGKNHKVTIQLY